MCLVRAVTVNYNGYVDTIQCLQSLQSQVDVECHPIVIDNASSNDSVVQIGAAYPDVKMIISEKNSGFCGGNNLGIAEALQDGCDYLFLVNNDTEMEPGCLSKLVACAQAHPEAAVVSPAMYLYSDRTSPWFTGSTMDLEEGTFLNSTMPLDGQTREQPSTLPWTTGCAMLVPVQRMREVGGFDERFFCYYEDVDWSLRARQLGYECIFCPQAILYHKVYGSSGRSRLLPHYYEARNRLLCLENNFTGSEAHRFIRHRTKRTLQEAKHMLRHPTAERGKQQAWVSILATFDYYRRRFGRCRYVWS